MQDKYIKLLARQIIEGKFSYDKKTATMTRDDSDPDQRHGLYKDGKLVKTYSTKNAADNVKARDPKFKDATVKKIVEAGMSGINRCAPAQDVSYEKILNNVKDTWKGQTVTVKEMDVATLQDYTEKAKQVNPATTPKYKMVKHAEGYNKATQRIAQKTSDRTRTYEQQSGNLMSGNRNRMESEGEGFTVKNSLHTIIWGAREIGDKEMQGLAESYADRLKKFI